MQRVAKMKVNKNLGHGHHMTSIGPLLPLQSETLCIYLFLGELLIDPYL